MVDIIEILIAIAILLIGIAIFSVTKQKTRLETYTNELSLVIDEAKQLKQDLHRLMENAIEISSSIVDELDVKLNNDNTVANELTADKDLPTEDNFHKLAQEYGLTVEQINNLFVSLGYKPDNDYVEKVLHAKGEISLVPDIHELEPQFITLIEDKLGNNMEKDLWQEVIDLDNQGYNIKEIAKKLERGQGEISLLLNLSKKSKAI